MAYRGASICVFCDSSPIAVCARCGCAVCAAHGITKGGWCAGCEKELRDDLDVVKFAAESSAPDGETPSLFPLLVHAISSWGWWSGYDARRVRRRFLQRTREDIAAWRRRAGIGRAGGA
jgi:hypothetical protein